MYGYLNILIKLCNYDSTNFTRTWNNLPDSWIDCVLLVYHGIYYTMNLDDGGEEYLTTSPDVRTSYDANATDIRKLTKKNISTINILTCNGGY